MFLRACCIFLVYFAISEAREDANSLYDRQIEKTEQQRIRYYSHSFKRKKQELCAPTCPFPCSPDHPSYKNEHYCID